MFKLPDFLFVYICLLVRLIVLPGVATAVSSAGQDYELTAVSSVGVQRQIVCVCGCASV